MYVPIVPFVPHTTHTTVVNKTIVYSDTVLPVKDIGNNLKVSTISNVSEYSLENCLKTVFESNPNVIFNTIQYSKNDKKVYFYTNQDISTKAYEESQYKKYKPITKSSEILEEVKNILVCEPNKNSDCISLYDVAQLLKKLRNNYEMMQERYRTQFKSILRANFGDSSSIVIYDFDYKKRLLKVGFKRWDFGDYEDISFAKENGDLYIAKSECCYDKEVFAALSSDLSNLYDEFMNFNDYRNEYNAKYDTKSVNSNFCVDISHFGASIFVPSRNNSYSHDFRLFSPSYADKYSLECNSSIVNEALNDKEYDIFKRIFVKIDNCPEWSQSLLYEIRQNQLAEEKRIEEARLLEKQKIEEEIQRREEKKQKRLELKRKIFPFLKK
ncbi:MAG: hypothetical protein IJD92_01600 [Bacilli bacterium]|nr:hypothetical protein [Bacilli bacterium]